MTLIERIKENWFNQLVKLVIIILFAIIMINQGKIIALVITHYTDLKQDPFSYGAKLYGIKDANCFIKEDVTLYFNQSESKFIIEQHGATGNLDYNRKE